jgi:hypothetical protein
LASPELHVRTLRLATGDHLLSFRGGRDAPGRTLAEEIERLPADAAIVINVDGLRADATREVIAVLNHSTRRLQLAGRLVVVSEDPALRRLFELSGPPGARIEDSLERAALRGLFGAWLDPQSSAAADSHERVD